MTPKRSQKFWSSKLWAKAKEWATYNSIGAKTGEGKGMTHEKAFHLTKTIVRLKL
jgi:hypothetical protein